MTEVYHQINKHMEEYNKITEEMEEAKVIKLLQTEANLKELQVINIAFTVKKIYQPSPSGLRLRQLTE